MLMLNASLNSFIIFIMLLYMSLYSMASCRLLSRYIYNSYPIIFLYCFVFKDLEIAADFNIQASAENLFAKLLETEHTQVLFVV